MLRLFRFVSRQIVRKKSLSSSEIEEKFYEVFCQCEQLFDAKLEAVEQYHKAQIEGRDNLIGSLNRRLEYQSDLIRNLTAPALNVSNNYNPINNSEISNEHYQRKIMSVEKGGIHDLNNVRIGQGANVIGGDLSGRVTTNINELPVSSDSHNPGVRELLLQLQHAIEEEFNSNHKGKEKALKQLESLAKAASNPNKNKEEADNATLILRGLLGGLSAGAALLSIVDKIRIFFGLG